MFFIVRTSICNREPLYRFGTGQGCVAATSLLRLTTEIAVFDLMTLRSAANSDACSHVEYRLAG
jgi:hypothetical protein